LEAVFSSILFIVELSFRLPIIPPLIYGYANFSLSMISQKRRHWLIVAGFTLVVGLSTWFYLRTSHHIDRLVVSRIALPSLGLVYLAEEQGFFADHSLEVEFRSYPTGRQAMADLEHNKADLVTVYQTPVLERALENQPLRVLSSLHNSFRGTAIIARRDRGIHCAADLVGRRVGVPLKTSGELFIRGVLKLEGIAWSSLKISDVSPSEFESRFLSGELDAAVIWEPSLHNVQAALAPNQVSTFYSDVYTEVSLLVTNDEVIQSKSGAIKKFLAALADAEEYLQNRPEEAFDVIVKAKDFRGQNIDSLRAAWNVYRLELKMDNLTALTLEKELALRLGSMDRSKTTVEISDLIRPELLEEVSPEAVTIFHTLSGSRAQR
jgi:ABC-type nitrate/sulfonate/bicarbonate transport system substrate-binding protein